ncbi:MAG: hypothetical protein Q9163_002688 [Psora crenata]
MLSKMTSTLPDPFELAPIDNIMPRSHVPTSRFFPASQTDPESVFFSLRLGLARTFQVLPLLSGTVKAARAGTQRGRLVVSGLWQTVDEAFTLVDVRDDPDFDYADLRARQFPTNQWSLQKASKIFELKSPQALEQPVLRAALTLIQGGLVLSVALHHWRSRCLSHVVFLLRT